MMNKDSRILVTGHRGLVGSALVRELLASGYTNIIRWTREDVNLLDPVAVKWAFSSYVPEYVFHCAARVGGIKDNADNQIEFFLENIQIQNNVITNSAEYGVKKLVFLGSSCVYPRDCVQPIREDALLSGPFEKLVEGYGLAKVCGIRLCQWYHDKGHEFISAMPCNLYGPGDNFNPDTAHAIPGMMFRMHQCKQAGSDFKVWGDGTARREFLYVDDLARALVLVMNGYHGREQINIGSGVETPIDFLASVIAATIGFDRQNIGFDSAKPTGTPRKIMDGRKIRDLGWAPATPLFRGLEQTYQDLLKRVPLPS